MRPGLQHSRLHPGLLLMHRCLAFQRYFLPAVILAPKIEIAFACKWGEIHLANYRPAVLYGNPLG